MTVSANQFCVERLTSTSIPYWVRRCLDGAAIDRFERDGMRVEHFDTGSLALVEARFRDADNMSASQLEAAVVRAYELIGRMMQDRELAALHPWRFWNFVPRLLSPAGSVEHRYMIFNIGRETALRRWHGEAPFERCIVAASAVDDGAGDLVVQMLAGPTPGRPIDNPRQCAAYRYSPQYGPVPPSFARATLAVYPVRGNNLLITAGTASIVGETTRHVGCLASQIEETIANLSALATEARYGADGLAIWSHMRAYVVHAADEPAVIAALSARCSNLQRLEIMPAQLCRPELLVEIEAMAECPLDPQATGACGDVTHE